MKFLVVDDHPLIRDAVRLALKELDEDATILEASRWTDAARLLEEHSSFALALLDLGLPDQNGFVALEELHARYPEIPIVILSANCNRDNIITALDLGAAGFIPKSGERKVMLSALRLVLSEGVYIPPEILPACETAAGPERSRATGPVLERPAQGAMADLGLTGRVVDVLALVVCGKSNKMIARRLNLSEPTVKNYVSAILKAMKVSNRTEAVIKAGALGWKFPSGDG